MADNRTVVHLENYGEDFEFLFELKEFLIDKVEKLSQEKDDKKRECFLNGVYETWTKNREVRTCFPHGHTELLEMLNPGAERRLWFVGFIGFKQQKLKSDIVQRIWKMDSALVSELRKHPYVVAYMSAERTAGGEWGNLVVMSSDQAVAQWESCQIHEKAVIELSPDYYSKVRIHRGRLLEGLRSASFTVDRTLFHEYIGDNAGWRFIKLWQDAIKSSHYFQVLSK
ncbi:hypothetical protein ScPMuIL_011015 [Solemya velum]